jgi:tRNA A-37 threonylcarbamoyl transferase component Bud32
MVSAELSDAARTLGLYEAGTIALWIEDGCGQPHAMGRAPTHIVELPGGGESLLLRRVLHGGALAALWRGRIGGIGRLRTELRTTAALLAAGAPVPRPALAIARRRGGLWEAALATVFEERTLDGLAFFASHPSPGRLAAAARAVGTALRRFHDLGGHHRDLHVGNLLLRESEGTAPSFEAVVIDLDRARLSAPASPAERAGELARLARSLRKRNLIAQCDSSVRDAFWSGYCAGDTSLREALRAGRRIWHRR